jgi:uncharacterized circularly permuted ATP-grasp superfamily protein/uncharacterized alpha-E superfamily protein
VRDYRPTAGTYDEAALPTGALRPHWRAFVQRLDALGAPEVHRRWGEARALIHENGVSYDVHGGGDGTHRPWPLSPVPVLMERGEWERVGAALLQRARLLELVLADLYGPQRLVKDGVLPAALVYGHPAFLRACQGVEPARGRWLPLYAVDLARGPDGAFRALADRTQVPTGAGYALENRIIVSRTLPEAFRACRVERVAGFFRTLRDALAGLAPRNQDNPRVVVLTSGPTDPTYFEQAYLAQYLGYPVVHGGDLTVRGGRVYLKTLGGLLPVDVILRRMQDDTCDPLELRPDSLLGVPGLLQAARERNVAIANPLGSGVAAGAALLPYLPALCRHLLGEELRLPSVRTWWLGDEAQRAEALAHLPDLVVKPAFSTTPIEPVFCRGLGLEALAELRARLLEAPETFVAQEQLALGTTPAIVGDGFEPRHWVLRAFLAASGAPGSDGHVLLPGGLARFAPTGGALEVSIRRGGGSKDVWILDAEPAPPLSLLPAPSDPVPLSRGGNDLPSRAADDLFWLGRYAERAESLARLGRVVLGRLGEGPDQERPGAEVGPLLAALGRVSDRPGLTAAAETGRSACEAVLLEALFDEAASGSLVGTVRSIQRVARECRDRLSTDAWRVLMALELRLEAGPGTPRAGVRRRLDEAVVTLAAWSGLVVDSMSRGHGWRFLDMGRRLERAAGLLALLEAAAAPCEREGPLLEGLLEAADSGMTYRRRYLTRLQRAPVVDLLLTDGTNPRSVAFQVDALVAHIAQLPQDANAAVRTPQHRLALELQSALELADVETLCAPGPDGRPAEGLGLLLARLGRGLPALSDSLGASYLNHAAVSRQLGRAGGQR